MLLIIGGLLTELAELIVMLKRLRLHLAHLAQHVWRHVRTITPKE